MTEQKNPNQLLKSLLNSCSFIRPEKENNNIQSFTIRGRMDIDGPIVSETIELNEVSVNSFSEINKITVES